MKDKQIVYLKTSEIKISRTMLRSSICPYALNRLASSIKSRGIIEPLLVRINENSEYEVISGNRRLAAAKQVGLMSVPCIIKKADALLSHLWAFCDNTYRERLTPFEEAEALGELVSRYKLTQNTAAQSVGLSPSAYSYKTALLKLNMPIRQRLDASDLGEDYARLLLKLPEDMREEVLDKIIMEKLCFADAEKLIQKLLTSPKSRFVKTAIGDVRLFANSLNKMVDTMKLSGINAVSEQNETKESIEYKVIIPK